MTESKSDARHIIVTSDEPWSETWHTQLHYAHQLARSFNVIFLGPPKPWRFSNFWNISLPIRQVETNLKVSNYFNLLPAFLGPLAILLNDKLNEYMITRQFFSGRKPDRLLVWHFDRYRSIKLFIESKKYQHIYHVIDPVANLNGDVQLARQASLVVVTSPRFMEHYRNLNSRVVQIGQGYDARLFSESLLSEQAVSLESNDSILLLGTITDAIDFTLLQKIAARYTNLLCLIGPDKITGRTARELFEKLLCLPSVRWLGAMPPVQFRKHLQACRVGIIAYDLATVNNNMLRSPLKVISYLAAGKNVISNIDCEIPSLTGKGIHVASNSLEFFSLLDRALKGSLLFDKDAVNGYLSSISYDTLLGIIFSKLGETLQKEISTDQGINADASR